MPTGVWRLERQPGMVGTALCLPGRSRFGIWDGLFLWFMLDNLTRPGYGDFFHHHQDDPGYQQWRAEADRLAADNVDLRNKLSALEQLAAEQDQPRDPNICRPTRRAKRRSPPKRTRMPMRRGRIW